MKKDKYNIFINLGVIPFGSGSSIAGQVLASREEEQKKAVGFSELKLLTALYP